MYKEKTAHRKEDKEDIPAQRKSNGTEEELLKSGKGKSVETRKMQIDWHLLAKKWTGLDVGHELLIAKFRLN